MSRVFIIIFKEIAIFLISISIFPAVIILILMYSDAQAYMPRILDIAKNLPSLWIHILTPYLAIQAIRAGIMAEKTLFGRKWAYLYFSFLAVVASIWAFLQVGDLFYFMYALGDIPGALDQLVVLEWQNLLLGLISMILAAYCFSVFLDPTKRILSKRKQYPST